MDPNIIKMGLATWINIITITLHKYVQSPISQVIVDSVKLTTTQVCRVSFGILFGGTIIHGGLGMAVGKTPGSK